jgi:hypothetical protein
MKIPVFVSCPTTLSNSQRESRKIILRELSRANLEPRALGTSDYPTELPLREIFVVAKHCAGGVILGFEQFYAESGTWKRFTDPPPEPIREPIIFPTPWNHLEAGILFSLGLPLLVFKEDGISGGVFDPGVSDVFIHKMPSPARIKTGRSALTAVFQKWQADVRQHYYKSGLRT